MKNREWNSRKNCAIALLSGCLLLPFHSAQADILSSHSAIKQIDSSLQFRPPELPDRGRPGGRQSGGASRGGCDAPGQPPLTALVPTYNNPEHSASDSTELPTADSVFSLTTKANPTFWFYTPYSISETPMELVIQDEQNNTLYQSRITAERNESGVISVPLPETATALEVGSLYRWYFMAYCNEASPAFVEGWIERVPVNSTLGASLENSALRAQAVAYAQNGIWQEAISAIGEQYQAQPNREDLLEDWKSLLESADLQDIAEEPLVVCCTL